MATTMYWLDVTGDRTGLDIRVNDIPVLHLIDTGGVNVPINEYLRNGDNRVEIRRGPFPSNADAETGGEIGLTVTRKRFEGQAPTGETVLAQTVEPFASAPVGVALAAVAFPAAATRAPDPSSFDPVDPAGEAAIVKQLARVADLWRRADAAGVIGWMTGYLADYVAAYPIETLDAMRGRIERMVAALPRAPAQVVFDPAVVRLERCAGDRLVDCLSPAGAAIRIERPGRPPYDFWTVVGLRAKDVVLVR